MGFLSRRRFGVTAGPTRAWLDPVRYLANASTGSLGAMISDKLGSMGAAVDHILGPGAVRPIHPNVRIHEADTPQDVIRCVEMFSGDAPPFDAWIHAMAILDFIPAETSPEKIDSDREEWNLKLIPTPKIIRRFKALYPDALLVGFKLETGDNLEDLKSAARHLGIKADCNLVVANFAPFKNPGKHTGFLFEPSVEKWSEPYIGKEAIADALVNWLLRRLDG
ncbi:MAG: hypothetical protein GHCLOJNM_00808 [bacterium]|nr:hypothetical protein [bacterium]